LILSQHPAESDSHDLAKYTMAVAVMMTGVAAHRIRKYEDFGLCKPTRTFSNQRLYSDQDIELIRQIASLDKKGVNIPGIRVILSLKQSRLISQSYYPSAEEV
jgi:MerR family transcriptional regulator, heat shock protein HspR